MTQIAVLGSSYDLPIFEGLTEKQINNLLRGSRVENHRLGECFFKEGQKADFFGYILSGAYKLTMIDANGDEIIMHFGVRGEALGIMATMLSPCNFPFDCVSMTDSQILVIPRQIFEEMWVHESTIMMRYQDSLQGRIFRSHDEKRLQRRPLAEKIAHLLIYLSEHKSNSLDKIEIPITRREIASYVGASVESVIRLMSVWSRENIIETFDRYIVIQSRSKLIEQTRPAIMPDLSGSKYESRLSRLWQATTISIKNRKKSK